MTSAEVYKDGLLAATLTADGTDTTFAYRGGYGGAPVAHTLPLGTRFVRPGRTLIVTRAEVFAVNDGKETLCALMQQTIMVMHGKIEK